MNSPLPNNSTNIGYRNRPKNFLSKLKEDALNAKKTISSQKESITNRFSIPLAPSNDEIEAPSPIVEIPSPIVEIPSPIVEIPQNSSEYIYTAPPMVDAPEPIYTSPPPMVDAPEPIYTPPPQNSYNDNVSGLSQKEQSFFN